MKPSTQRRPAQHRVAAAAMTVLLTLNPIAFAAPGAHGPNGEHLDGPATTSMASTLPRLEAQSESFELVAELRPEKLVIVVDRYETNEPVLGAQIEVESGGVKAVATFRAEQGDYVITDTALRKALAAPGEHGLVFTLVAGAESDLLDGTLVAGASTAAQGEHGHSGSDHGHEHGHGHDHALERAAWVGGGIAALGLLGGTTWWRQRRRSAGQAKGTL
jgi:hypothetical protein